MSRELTRGVSLIWLAAACVDSSGRDAANGENPAPEPITLITTDPVPPEISNDTPTGPYVWRNVVIKGGGFVTGIVFSLAAPNLVYARTDVGGAYRFDVTNGRWIPLTDWVGQADSNLMGIESVAADPVDPRRVYLAAGTYLSAGSGVILHSEDFGKTWTRGSFAESVPMGGNHDGRSMGERLAVDPNQTSIVYFGSRNSGLWMSADSAATWQRVTSFPVIGDATFGLSFVLFDSRSGAPGAPTPTLYVGVATLSGDTLYRSTDAGSSWQAVAGVPTTMMPHHAALAPDSMLYLVYNNGPGPNNITSGALWRYDTASGEWSKGNLAPTEKGLGGLSVDASRPGTVMVSTIDVWSPDEIYRTIDSGEHWAAIGSRAPRDPMGTQWLYFGGSSLSATGWMGDIEIDPFNRSRVLHVTGQGIWWSDDVTQNDAGYPATWSFRDDGLEETVPLDLVSPPSGAELLSGLGDVAGFRHDDLWQSPPQGMFGSPRFGNTSSLDFAESNPSIVVRVGTANSGIRGAYSTAGGTSWQPFVSEPAGSQGEGSIVVSADGQTFVWSPRRTAPAYSRDLGKSWIASSGISGGARLAADRVNPSKLYAVSGSSLYVSTDGGASFSATVSGLPGGTKPRTVFGCEGDVWLVSNQGLQHSTDSGATVTQLPGVAAALALGFGQAAPGKTYPALYLSGTAGDVQGIFRSDDGGQSFSRIDDARHQFGWFGVITGDPRRYGRVYLGTGGRGIVYGDIL